MTVKTIAEPEVRVEVALAPRVNLAFHQNSIPLLREVTIRNGGEKPLSDVELVVQSEPAFFKIRTWRIDAIGPGQSYHLSNLDLSLDAGLLSRLTEAEAGQAVFVLKACGEEVARLIEPIELLPRNHWGGIGHMPEMVAAFVQPNDPAVDRVLKRAADILREHGREGALNGNEGGAKRAWELVSALWAAVGSLGLDYALPPASFEHAGQKVRSPSQVCENGIATCLDTTLLFCACLEQCGLNPLIVVTHGHAFAGVWLRAEDFSSVVVDDVTSLRKRVKLNEMVLFETTLVTHRPCPPFSRAVEHAAKAIAPELESFELAVDIRRARMQRIRPLASAEAAPVQAPAETETVAAPLFEDAPDLPDEDVQPVEEKPSTPQGRLERWQRKLLDLSLRNNLLNFRASKRVLRLEAPDPGQLEDFLAAGRKMRILPHPDLMEGEDPRSQVIHEERHGEDVRRNHALDALARNELLVRLEQSELESRLVDLYRTARSSLQEGGANTLFLALGFLSWRREEKEDKAYRAPLILLPITLERKSVKSGFTLMLHEDEPRFNPTLIEMLRQDFGLALPINEGELPRDDSGLDIAGIWRMVAQAVKDIKGWEVVEEVVLSTFSFAKYLMWKDLADRSEQLKQNPVVRHLIETPREPYPSPQSFPYPRELDRSHGPEQTFCPLPSDSSQLSAVMAAANGKDFVLVGPPGTGKSQTIANLIAQCLAERKTVLFVSEKIAALDVVYRRLREVGLGEFCLELHSSKARKLDVLDQLRRSWEAKGEVDAEEWKREAWRLSDLRSQLNLYVEHLHKRHRNGLTAHIAIGRILSGSELPALGHSWPSADAHDHEGLDRLRDLAERLDVNASQVGSVADNPLGLIAHAEWSPNWQQTLLKAAADLLPAAERLEQAAKSFHQVTGLPDCGLARRGRDGLAALARLLPEAAGRDWRFALRPDARSIADGLGQGMALLKRHQDLMGQLSVPFGEDIALALRQGLELVVRHRSLTASLSVPYAAPALAGLDVVRLKTDWDKAEKSFWPLGWLGRRSVRSALAAAAEGGQDADVGADLERLVALRKIEDEIAALGDLAARSGVPWAGLSTKTEDVEAALSFRQALATAREGRDWQDDGFLAIAEGRCGAAMAADLDRMRGIRALEREVAALEDLSARTGGLWAGLRTRLDELEQALAFREKLAAAIAALADTPEALADVKTPLERLLGDGNPLLEATGAVAGAGKEYCDGLDVYAAKLQEFFRQAGITSADTGAMLDDTPASVIALCQRVQAQAAKLHAWCSWRKVRMEAMAHGLAPLVAAIETGIVAPGGVREAFEVDYCRWWLNAVVDGDQVLRHFVSAEHEKRIADFRRLDDRFTDLTRAYVRAGLCAELPDQEGIGKNSEWGVLKREMQKKTRHLPLRELVGRMPTALTKLAPCLLMSPLSIAQYLSAETAAFDLVVFDEASQIPVWDAVGAIARGRQVVMVGDPKQLPPTNFFGRSDEEGDDDVETEGDLESILDECLGANLPVLNLTWHYRSRHESLIAFSNHRYYSGGLVTFPSPVTEDRAVSFHFIPDGIYEKGGARINQQEAKALVADMVCLMRDPVFVASRQTIGVVTFNSEQQRLIEDLLDEERRKDPSLEPFFAEDALEPVFVKNLESVQGDERDVMYFSITYGPDRSGAVSMNFGPMNRDGGERRLNVAITRARHALRVFSSLRPERMDLSRTKAEGVKDLKHFLEFAERGKDALAEANFGSIGDYDSPFEKWVAQALAGRGWQVHPQVGVSSFRIDLGVVDPDAPGRYLAGVECDGATYHRSATARDRDKLREQVLRGLGWEILRIWSTDWWHDAAGALDKVHARLTELLEQSRARRAAEEARKEAEAHEVPVVVEAIETEAIEDVIEEPPVAEKAAPASRRQEDDLFQGQDFQLIASRATGLSEPPVAAFDVPSQFREADPACVGTPDPNRFFDAGYEPVLRAMIAEVVTVEGPVRDDVLARRIARAHGWQRTGSRIRDRVSALAAQDCEIEAEGDLLFVWQRGSDKTWQGPFRRPASEETARPVDEIALAELAALAREVMELGESAETGITTMARILGLKNLRAASRERLEVAWAWRCAP
ncbi:DUF3320 domain-containing protein [Telmatospirillum sp. J64-1]|uniref:DUF3320 domain-containing protein n=1 Tax=Telmatospirillum sp. J64-1 TaxID=2502183 RepID=UPI00115D91C5|nr:DUF3320 domain-containing protein [Telmatospirillum sp. J64-1]